MVKGRCGGGRRHGLDGNHRGRKEGWAIQWGWVGKMSYQSDNSGSFAAGGRGIVGRALIQVHFLSSPCTNSESAFSIQIECPFLVKSLTFLVCSELQTSLSFILCHIILHSGPYFAFFIVFFLDCAPMGLRSGTHFHWLFFPDPKLSYMSWHSVHNMVWTGHRASEVRTTFENLGHMLKTPSAPRVSGFNSIHFIVLPPAQIPGFLPSLIWRCILLKWFILQNFCRLQTRKGTHLGFRWKRVI